MAERLEQLARAYFDCWNTRDGAAVGRKFTADGTLRDWDFSVSGAQAVGEANGGIFKAVPGIAITVEGIIVDAAKSSCACEILVHLNDAEKTVLKARPLALGCCSGAACSAATQCRTARRTAFLGLPLRRRSATDLVVRG